VGAYSIPFFSIQFIMKKWPFSSALCDIWLSIDYMASNASVMNLLAISVDRWLTDP
jgi:muscarinic acetylcholine receptor M3